MPQSGPSKGDFVEPLNVEDLDERADALPAQEEFWRPPVRFGSIPVEKEPLGWDRRRGFRKLFPVVSLPTQVVERVSFGHPTLEPNRLFWGDNLHVMRQLPSQSIDLIYIDPPFFSGRQYNVIFGDQNELRSFSDIWEGGLPGYLIWLNARLYQMKRLLKPTGSIYVHCDWHASHYIKAEMDKIFGVENLVSEIIWNYGTASGGRASGSKPVKAHDTLFCYARAYGHHVYNKQYTPYSEKYISERFGYQDETGRRYQRRNRGNGVIHRQYLDESPGVPLSTVWSDITQTYSMHLVKRKQEEIGYPTQKPEALLERIITASSNEAECVADFFCGGGTTPAVAQRLGRRWVACDQSRVAVAITADRMARAARQITLEQSAAGIPDFTVEHWGVYEAKRLADAPPDQFRQFVLRAFGASTEPPGDGTHGAKGAVPVWVGAPDQKAQVTAEDVQSFANAIRKTIRYRQDNLRDGIMIAWAFRPDAIQAAEYLREREHTDLNFVRLDLLRIDSPRFREHVAALSTDHADYENFLTFVYPPQVEVGYKRLHERVFAFDVSETVVMNPGAQIINVQWDFDYDGRFTSTPGYSFVRGAKKEPALQVQYEFDSASVHTIACKVQDDMGGEGIWVGKVEVK